MVKMNCWEYMRCGREPGGLRSDLLGVCPACTFKPFDRVHGGRAAGRTCWAVDNTLCSGKPSGGYSTKLSCCSKCSFYKLVAEQEKGSLILSIDILRTIEQRVNALPFTMINKSMLNDGFKDL